MVTRIVVTMTEWIKMVTTGAACRVSSNFRKVTKGTNFLSLLPKFLQRWYERGHILNPLQIGGKGLNASWFPQQIIDQLLPPAALHPLREETFNPPPQNLSGPLDTSFSDCNLLAEQWKEIKVYYGPHFLLSKNFTPELVAISVPPLMKVGLQKEERANRNGRNFIVVESPSALHTFGWDLCVSTFGICLPSFALPVQGILCTVHV